MIDSVIRFTGKLISLRYIASYIPLQAAAIVGETTGKYVALGKRKLAIANIRRFTPRGRRILKKYKSYTGYGVIEELLQPGRTVGENINTILYGLLMWNRKITMQDILLGNMTKAEFKSETISNEKLAEIKKTAGRWVDVGGARSIAGSTSPGASFTKFRSWAFPIMSSTLDNAMSLARTLTRIGDPNKRLNRQQLQEFYRLAEIGAFAATIAAVCADDERDTFTGNLKYHVIRELFSQFNAISIRTVLTLGVTADFLRIFAKNLDLLVSLERTKKTKELKGLKALKRQFMPAGITQFMSKEKKTKKRGGRKEVLRYE